MEDRPTYEELILKNQELSTAKAALQKRIERYALAFEAADDELW